MSLRLPNTEYPNNEVFETIGGHIVEYDSTADKRRHRYQHPNSSFVEWQEEGYIQRLTTDAYLIKDRDEFVLNREELQDNNKRKFRHFSGR